MKGSTSYRRLCWLQVNFSYGHLAVTRYGSGYDSNGSRAEITHSTEFGHKPSSEDDRPAACQISSEAAENLSLRLPEQAAGPLGDSPRAHSLTATRQDLPHAREISGHAMQSLWPPKKLIYLLGIG